MTASHDRPTDPPAKLAAALGQLARARRVHRQELATRHGVSPLQLDVLALLVDGTPPEPVVGLIARELGVSQPTITDAVIALERKGLVRRERSDEAPRRTYVRLTPEGTAIGTIDDPLIAAAAALDPALRDTALAASLSMIGTLVDNEVITVARTCITCRFYRHDNGESHCGLLNIPLPQSELRVNCPEHEAVR